MTTYVSLKTMIQSLAPEMEPGDGAIMGPVYIHCVGETTFTIMGSVCPHNVVGNGFCEQLIEEADTLGIDMRDWRGIPTILGQS